MGQLGSTAGGLVDQCSESGRRDARSTGCIEMGESRTRGAASGECLRRVTLSFCLCQLLVGLEWRFRGDERVAQQGAGI